MRTQVAIVGGGPAGLMLGRLLELRGIESVILEARDREYVQQRVRAGVLEQATMDLMDEVGPRRADARRGARPRRRRAALRRRGPPDRADRSHRRRAITIYGQQEVVKDLIERGWRRVCRCTSRSPTCASTRRRGVVRYHPRRRRARAGRRPDRGLRRLPRRLPAGDRRRADRLRARVPVRLDGHPRRTPRRPRRS